MNPATSTFLKNLDKDVAQIKAELDKQFWREQKDKLAFRWAVDHGWHDWFCHESALVGRTAKYGSQINSIVKAVPILGKNTIVGFSQSYGEGYNDSYYIQNPNGTFGYGIKVNFSPSVPYYVYRIDRWSDSDYNAKTFNDVLNFIRKDVIIWLAGGKTVEYDAYKSGRNSVSGHTQSRIKATKSVTIVPDSPLGRMYIAQKNKGKKTVRRE